MIPQIDASALRARDAGALEATRIGAEEVGFLTLQNTTLDAPRVTEVLAAYRAFFKADPA